MKAYLREQEQRASRPRYLLRGLVVWFSLRVREAPGSTPGEALISCLRKNSCIRKKFSLSNQLFREYLLYHELKIFVFRHNLPLKWSIVTHSKWDNQGRSGCYFAVPTPRGWPGIYLFRTAYTVLIRYVKPDLVKFDVSTFFTLVGYQTFGHGGFPERNYVLQSNGGKQETSSFAQMDSQNVFISPQGGISRSKTTINQTQRQVVECGSKYCILGLQSVN